MAAFETEYKHYHLHNRQEPLISKPGQARKVKSQRAKVKGQRAKLKLLIQALKKSVELILPEIF